MDVIAPSVYERITWSFFGERIVPALLAITGTTDGVDIAYFICDDFTNISSRVPLYGNQQSMSRHETLSALRQALQSFKVEMGNHSYNRTDLEHTILLLNKSLKEACSLQGPAITTATPADTANLAAAEAFINMNNM